MRNFPFNRLRGIETFADPVDLDRGSLSRAQGAVPYPRDALASGPIWRPSDDLTGHTVSEAFQDWLAHTATAEAPDTPGVYTRSREDFPNHEFSVLSNSGALFMAGDTGEPQRVWIAESPNKRESVMTGVESLVLSHVDILNTGVLNPASNPVSIRALSAYQDYILVHHNYGVTVLYDVTAGQDPNTGYRVRQSSTPLSSGAVNHESCHGRMFIGNDGQLWADAATAGPPDKIEQRSGNLPAYKSTGGYEHLLHKNWREDAFSVWVPTMGMFLPFFRLAKTNLRGFFVFNRESLALTGPIRCDNAVRAGNIRGTDIVVVQLSDESYVWTDLGELREREISGIEEGVSLASGFGTDPSAATRITLNWQDYGHGDAHKITEEIHLNFQHGSYGQAAVEVENESGQISGSQSRVQNIHGSSERLKFFTNINGRRFRIHIFITGVHGRPWVLRNVSAGYNIGNPI